MEELRIEANGNLGPIDSSRIPRYAGAATYARLPRLDAGNARRREIAGAYDAALEGGSLTPPLRREGATHVFHQYVLRSAERDLLQGRLRAQGIGTGIHYPVPVHLQPAYRGRIALGPARCAETEATAREVLSLPMFPELTDAQVERVCGALRDL